MLAKTERNDTRQFKISENKRQMYGRGITQAKHTSYFYLDTTKQVPTLQPLFPFDWQTTQHALARVIIRIGDIIISLIKCDVEDGDCGDETSDPLQKTSLLDEPDYVFTFDESTLFKPIWG